EPDGLGEVVNRPGVLPGANPRFPAPDTGLRRPVIEVEIPEQPHQEQGADQYPPPREPLHRDHLTAPASPHRNERTPHHPAPPPPVKRPRRRVSSTLGSAFDHRLSTPRRRGVYSEQPTPRAEAPDMPSSPHRPRPARLIALLAAVVVAGGALWYALLRPAPPT